jgi:hypothetical protein
MQLSTYGHIHFSDTYSDTGFLLPTHNFRISTDPVVWLHGCYEIITTKPSHQSQMYDFGNFTSNIKPDPIILSIIVPVVFPGTCC